MKKADLIFSVLLVPVDYLMIVLAAIAAYGLRFAGFVAEIRPIVFTLPFIEYLTLVLLIAFGWLAIFAISKLYVITGQRSLVDEVARIFLACSTSVAAVIIFIFFRRELFSSRFIIIAVWIFSFIFVSLGRVIVRKIQRYFYKKNYGTYKVVIVGADKTGDLIVKELNRDKSLGYEVVRQVDGFNEGVKALFNQLKSEDKLDEVIAADINLLYKNRNDDISQSSRHAPFKAEDAISGCTAESGAVKICDKSILFKDSEALNLINYCQEYHIGFKYAADIFKNITTNIEIGMIAGVPIIEIKETKLDGWGKIWKRIFDIAVSFILIILFSPILLIIAIIIKLDSKGPVFFSYNRVGARSKPFRYFKYRSMKADSHRLRFDEGFQKKYGNLRAGTPMIKLKDDPRITRVGKFLRRYSLDELAELFNVFIGKMSLVGPRPHELEEVAKYEKRHKKILAIKPGMTGLAQIYGRSDLSFEEEVKFDTFYIENWSLRLDLWILLKTPLVLLKKRRAL